MSGRLGLSNILPGTLTLTLSRGGRLESFVFFAPALLLLLFMSMQLVRISSSSISSPDCLGLWARRPRRAVVIFRPLPCCLTLAHLCPVAHHEFCVYMVTCC
ncbi:hypothetical protein AVEN_32840-1 [Araneus ventricosus]|uniref:Uncharacterized protein n=1 Tax=Araneus ventricosus TaxID=182803 RepID=A0A4Y2E0J5_ARAVE|nr:hypothetical protein AVEN_32840-1 [Araneus ventricosus]